MTGVMQNYAFMSTLLRDVVPALRDLSDAGLTVIAIKILSRDKPRSSILVENSVKAVNFAGAYSGACEIVIESNQLYTKS